MAGEGIHPTGGWSMTPGLSRVLRLLAVIAFVLACFGVMPGGFSMIAVGLALWCASTFV
jgi:hypothetical protein